MSTLPLASRRQLLKTMGAATLSCPFAGVAVAGPQSTSASAHGKITDAPIARTASQDDHVPFHGQHQAGITTPRPANGMLASFDVIAESADELERLFKRVTERVRFLTAGGEAPVLDPLLPPSDSGILGPYVRPDALTVTLALGASLFEERPWLKHLKPRHLSRMTEFPNDALVSSLCHGDMTLQFCANMQDTTIHALRDIVKNIPDQLVLRWKQEGNVPVVEPNPEGVVESARNFLGFRDGTANPDSSDIAVMDRVVWVSDDRGEPAWAVGGSYQAVRIIRNFVERWDRTPLNEQERIFGRKRVTGAPLSAAHESEFYLPDFTNDPEGKITPLDSHIRLANPRTPGSEENRILRRPFNYSNGITKSGHLDQGLLFIAYQADLEKGFITMQRHLDGEPLEEYIQPVGGGYFYAVSGVKDEHDYLASSLIGAARG
jgi:deferrochelatase/peroxidase EfeB